LLLPRIKDRHQPFRFDDGTLRIGGEIYGLATEITDPQGVAWTTLTLMDGTRTTEDVTAGVRKSFPGMSRSAARYGTRPGPAVRPADRPRRAPFRGKPWREGATSRVPVPEIGGRHRAAASASTL
jgi:hypothetical protein